MNFIKVPVVSNANVNTGYDTNYVNVNNIVCIKPFPGSNPRGNADRCLITLTDGSQLAALTTIDNILDMIQALYPVLEVQSAVEPAETK